LLLRYQVAEPLLSTEIIKFKPLMTRIEEEKIDNMLAANKVLLEEAAALQGNNNKNETTEDADPISPTIEYDDLLW